MFRHTISAFKEHKTFAPGRPWSVVELRYALEAFAPPHYADTVEILICNNAKGFCYVGRQCVPLGGQQVIFIAPGIIHSAHYLPYDGYVRVLKLQPEKLQQYLNLNELLRAAQCGFADLPIAPDLYEAAHSLAELFLSAADDVPACLAGITGLFAQLVHRADSQTNALTPLENDPFLYRVITWTEENFKKSIRLEELAAQMGYTKSYFCNKFKRSAGVPYVEYLTSVRIAYACRLLQKGHGTAEVYEACGFTSASYFIKKFQKYVKATPMQYAKQYGKNL